MKLKITLLFILFTICTNSIVQGNQSYLRTKEYNSIKISSDEFKSIIESIEYYYNEIPKDSTLPFNEYIFKCDLINEGQSLTLSTFEELKKLDFEDMYYTEIFFLYSWKNKSISNVTLNLKNSYRVLTVSGTDEKKVEALYRDLDEQLESNETTLSWINWNETFGLLSTIFFVFSIILCFSFGRFTFSKNRTKSDTFIFIVTGLYCIIAAIFYFSPYTFQEMMPRFILSPDNSTWIERNGNIIGFLSFIITIIGILYKSIKTIVKQKPFSKESKVINPNETE